MLPSSDAPPSAGPAGLAVIALFVLCVATPPEIHGLSLAAVGIVTALAVVVTAARAAASAASRWVWVAVPAAVVAIRIAIAPGEAVEPVAVLLIAALAGIAAAEVTFPVDMIPKIFAFLVACVSLRALYEALWGLANWAEEVRASAPAGEAAAVLNRLEQGRPYAGFITPAALGCFLAMTIPAVLAWALGKRGTARAVGIGVAAIGGAGLIATRSMSAMAALVCAVVLAALGRRVSPRWLAGALLSIGLAIAVVGIARPDAVFAPSREESPWRLRAGNIRIALEIARDHPLSGVGPGGYAEAYPQHRRAGDNESRHAHDLPAELMAEWGIPAGLALSILFFWLFAAPVVRAGGEPRTFASGLSVGLGAFAFHNLLDFTAFLPSLLIFAAVSRGLLASTAPRPASGHLRSAAWVALACAIAAAASGSGMAREALFDARRAAQGGDHALAWHEAHRAERLAPWDADPPQLASEALMASGAQGTAEALAAADRAVDRAPSRAAARATRARARSAMGDSTGAYADLVEAARLYPMYSDYRAQRDALAEALSKASGEAPR